MDFSWISTIDGWAAFATLTALEIVLGIDNIIFISILAGKLPEAQQPKARRVGLALALISRLLLLGSLAWIMKLEDNLFTVFDNGISGRDLILIGGGLFLLAKATREIHVQVEGHDEEAEAVHNTGATMRAVLIQIMLLDLVFSLDSVITAVGMAEALSIMVTAVVVAVGVMLVSADAISGFVMAHPTVKMLALSFLLLVGMALVADGLGLHIPKGYLYFAMAFSVMVEMLNLRASKNKRPSKAKT